MARKNSQMKDIVRESMEELRHGDFPDDPKLSEQLMSGPERFERHQKHKDEVVIDSLLADISGKTGYFVKLKKEVRPNEYMLMKVIENDWRKWPDIETEVRNIVVEHTKINPVKWGTGVYRLEVSCKGGMRGKGYDPIELHINAEEEFNAPQVNGASVQHTNVDPNVAVASKLEELRTLVDVIGGIVPKPQDPAMVQTQIAQAFQQGMQMKSNESTSMTTVMSTMMTGMIGLITAMMQNNKSADVPRIVNPEETLSKTIGMLKDVGAFGAKEQPKTIVDFAKELQALGIDLFKKDDPMEQINKLKQMAGIASQFMGMGGEGEKPSVLERIIDVLGPSIPKMISDFKTVTENAAKAQIIAGQNIRNAQIPMTTQQTLPNAPAVQETGEPTTYQRMGGGNVNPAATTQTQQVQQNVEQPEQVKQFFAQLYESVKTNNRMFYPVIYTSLLQDQSGIELVQGIAQGTHNAKHLVDMLQQHGDERFRDSQFVMKNLVPYVNGFIMWTQQMAGVKREEMSVVENTRRPVTNVRPKEEFDVICGTCRTVFSYPNEAAFLTDTEKNCGEEGCTGFLEPYTKAS